MNGEEMERAIEFLLQSQAALEARMGQVEEQIAATQRQVSETQRQVAETQGQVAETQRQVAETNRIVQTHAGTQTQFIQAVTTAVGGLAERQSRTEETLKLFIESQKRINEALVEAQRRSAEEQRGVNESLVEWQRRTDDKVDRLAETIERFIREGRNGRG